VKRKKMAGLKITGKDLLEIGFESGKSLGVTLDVVRKGYKNSHWDDVTPELKKMLSDPESFLNHKTLGRAAETLIVKEVFTDLVSINEDSVDYDVYGREGIEKGAFDQIDWATKLPVAIQGALMPDAHKGYGLPIGGVLATEGTIIPYGVGVDIGCRMCLTVYDTGSDFISGNREFLSDVLKKNAFFGINGNDTVLEHEVLDSINETDVVFARNLIDKAQAQLGTSGGGNHFIDFGHVDITDVDNEFGLEIGRYFGILSHSGSRGFGAKISNEYTERAMNSCVLPSQVKYLAWLDMNSQDGHEYWIAMNLAGDYASACHEKMHERISKALGIEEVGRVENHHNFAWKEMVNGKEAIVHRKGATPAGEGVMGIIPGSMVSKGYIVRGKGNPNSLSSASHGAGRLHSRTKCKELFNKEAVAATLRNAEVTLIGGGLDEAPDAYKDIDTVMSYQNNLVDVVGSFTPQVVRMASSSEEGLSWKERKDKKKKDQERKKRQSEERERKMR
tara:strand:- start:488 stop:1999 length:1512 start_codon:yes stop_codon:yes gene_type:complete